MHSSKKRIRKEGIRGALSAMCGFLLSAASMMGAHPFGIAYAAASRDLEIWRFGGVFLGCILAGGDRGVLYGAICLILFACRIVFRETNMGRNRIFLPGCAAFFLLFVKGILLFSGFSWQDLTLLIFETAFCLTAALLFSAMQSEDMGFASWLGRGLMIVSALAAFEPSRGYLGLSPACIAACVYVLRGALTYGGAAGASAGALLGVVIDLCSGGEPKLCLIYGLGGLLCGGAGYAPRALRISLWTLGCVFPALWAARGIDAVFIIIECTVVGAVVSLLMQKEGRGTPGGGKSASGAGFELIPSAAAAIQKLGEQVSAGAIPCGDSVGNTVNRAADKVCRSCPNAPLCWNEEYVSTSGVLNDVAFRLRQKSSFAKEDMPSHFTSRCLRMEAFCEEINRQLAANMHRREITRVRQEGEELMKKQYDGIAELLKDLSRQHTGKPESSGVSTGKIAKVIRTYYPGARWDSYYENGEYTIDVFVSCDAEQGDGYAAAASLSLAVGCKVEPPVRIKGEEGDTVRFKRCEKYAAEGAVALKARDGEKVSGDSVRRFTTNDGRAIVLISDGMGTGSAARELSAAATDMIADLVKAGASLKCAAFAVLPVIEARFERSGFVTLDLLELDLFCGNATFIKCGAPQSIIIRGDREERVFKQSLPAGLKDEPAIFESRLKEGDTVVMMTDGITYDGKLCGSPGEICQTLTEKAANDDMTAVALRLKEA